MNEAMVMRRNRFHKVKAFFHENGDRIAKKLQSKRGDSHLVAIVLAIAVTIALCIIFQKQVGSFFSTVFTTLGTSASTLLNFTGSNG